MGKLNRNMIGVFALLMASLVFLGCTGQPSVPVQQPAPNPAVCATDLHLCPDGTSVARDPANGCQFIACPQPAACPADSQLCPDGSYVSRNASKNCAFDDCQNITVCTMDARSCPDGSYVARNVSKNCAFDDCPLIANQTQNNSVNSTLAGEGADCAGASGIGCQPGLQCITSGQQGAPGTCTAPAPASQDLVQCPSVRNTACAADINPVCGKGTDAKATFRDYANPCVACSTSSNAIGYYMGACANK